MHKVYAWYIYVCAFVCESTGIHGKCQRTTLEVWSQSLTSTLGVCVQFSPSIVTAWLHWGLQAGTITCPQLLSHHRLLGGSMTPTTLLEIVSHHVALVGLELAMKTRLTWLRESPAFPSSLAQGLRVCSTNYSWYPPCSLRQGIPFCWPLCCCSSGYWLTNFQGFSYLVDMLGLHLPFYKVLGIKLRWLARATACWTTLMAWH